ncbi:MAG TPA: SRPBCC family protein [Coriobacteriia bacterium]|nr:SRPBCC family protein [Coriobacteriia bacterium]
MKYTQEIVIDAPRARVVELFTDPDHFTDWQPGLECYERTSGEQAQTGATAELTTRAGNRVTGMTETIERNALPDELNVIYETHGVWNRNANRFVEESPTTTRWISENEFRFTGVRKALGMLEGSFKKESLDTMERFKAFAEKA